MTDKDKWIESQALILSTEITKLAMSLAQKMVADAAKMSDDVRRVAEDSVAVPDVVVEEK